MHGRQARTTVQVVAPMAGTVVALEDVPDPVFSGRVVGPGLALVPTEPQAGDGTTRVVVVSPCSGRVVSVYPHAVMVESEPDRSVLVHLGLDTGQLEGRGFDVVAAEGERVVAGQPLLAWSPEQVRSGGRSTLTPLVALQAQRADVVALVEPGDVVAEGQVVLLWS